MLAVVAASSYCLAGGQIKPSPLQVKTVTGYRLAPVQSATFNTLSLPIQINNHFLIRGEMEHDNPIPPLKWNFNHGTASTVPVGSATLIGAPKVQYKYPGIGATGWVPPDVNIGVGPSYITETVNATVAFFNKATGAMVFSQDFQTFFAPLNPTSFLFDPKTMYDPISQRFFVMADEQDSTGNVSKLDIAVSANSDPNGSWHEYRIQAAQTIGGNAYWLDYPSLACSSTGVVMTGNMFPFSNGGFGGVQFIVLPKAPMLIGNPVTPVSIQDASAGSAQMARNWEATQSDVYGMALSSSSTMRVYDIQNPNTTKPSLKMVDVAIPAFTGANAANSIDGTTLDTIGDRIFNAYERNGHLLAGHSVLGPTGTSNARWYQFAINGWPTSGNAPTLLQSGQISSGASDDDFQPAIDENKFGDISVLFSRSNPQVEADILLSTRVFTDPLGQTTVPLVLQRSVGTAPYTAFRWGDFFEVAIDPVDNSTFWGGEEAIDANGNWQTYFFTWTTNVDTGGVNYLPTGYTVLQGTQTGGTLGSFDAVDHNTFNMNSGIQKGYGSVTNVETTYSGIPAPNRYMAATYDVNTLPGATVFLYAYNYTTQVFDLISTKPALSTAPVTVNIANYNNYLNNGQAKLMLREAIPNRTKLNIMFPDQTDQLIISSE